MSNNSSTHHQSNKVPTQNAAKNRKLKAAKSRKMQAAAARTVFKGETQNQSNTRKKGVIVEMAEEYSESEAGITNM